MSLGANFKRFLFKYSLIPTHKWRLPATILVASLIGLGFYGLRLSNATSYLSDDPQACVNCHIMTPQYESWKHSSHREVASCNDCHVPHNNVANKYYFKAKDGLYHASIFTLRAEPQVIRAKAPSREVIQKNCVRCHENQVTDARLSATVEKHKALRTDRECWSCHKEVPHGKVKSISAVNFQTEPLKALKNDKVSIVPQWLQDAVKTPATNKK